MTIEEITQTLQTVAENQATHSAHMAEMEKRQAEHLQNMRRLEEAHARHTADVAEIDKMIAANVESLNRHDRQLDRLFELVGVLSDRQIENERLFAENEKRFASLADGMRRLEGSYDLLETFVRSVREETRDYFAETDRKMATLAVVQAETAELVAEFVKDTNGRFAETDKRLAEFVSETNRRFSVIERNGSRREPKARAKKPGAKKSKKGAK